MKTLKNILFITIISLLTFSCTDTTEDLITNEKQNVENTLIFAKEDLVDNQTYEDTDGDSDRENREDE